MHMASVTRTELNQQTARVLARVAVGDRVTITDRGRPIAELASPAVSRWDELVANGTITPPRAHGTLPFEPVDSDQSAADTLDALRADRA